MYVGREMILGRDHVQVCETRILLAGILETRGKLKEAVVLCQRSLLFLEAHYGSTSPKVHLSTTLVFTPQLLDHRIYRIRVITRGTSSTMPI